MDEQQFYIEDTLANTIWNNERYVFTFTLGNPNLFTLTDKEKAPHTGSGSKYYIVKEDWYYVIRIVAGEEVDLNVVDYKIDAIDKATGTMTLSLAGGQWAFKRVD